MHITSRQTASQPGGAEHFTGEVWMEELATPGEESELAMLRVLFLAGAHTDWHQHPRGQILHVIEGAGQIQVHGEQVTPLRAGDTVVSPGGEWHWHGASPDTTATMITVQGTDADGKYVRWGEPVADDSGGGS